MTRRSAISVFLLSLLAAVSCQTPVIGGSCKLGTSDVQIGGKQTQFFLKCEAASDSADGEGVWVVKSRAASPPQQVQPVPAENSQPQARPPMRKMSNPNICEQDNGAREQDSCAVSATCLQAHNENPTFYLQCDQTNMRWVKKSCQDGFLFNFEQQTCVVPKRNNPINRQPANPTGLVCTFASCSSSNPCSSGTCNNGYCCSSGSSTGIMLQPANSGCVGCNQSPPVITIPSNSCPGGGYAVGTCSSGYCSPGYSCVSGSCCPTYSQPSVRVYTCPSGTPAVGACMSGSCATGYSCVSGSCCPSTTTQNPFVCPDGTQAAGGCVNGQCGNGYTCSSGLCCAGTSNTVRCLDGSEAVGACIPSCQGNACGGSTVSYYCGSGYTCTTGNICCAINSCPNGGEVLGPTVNGLCPSGYVAQGSICCSASCPDGSTPTAMVNGNCIAGNTIQNGVCCPAAAGVVECSVELSRGGCVNGRCEVGYLCDTATQERCCPVVDLENPDFQIGPTMEGLCPLGFAVVVFPDAEIDANGQPIGTCISLQSVRDICKIEEQNGPCQNYQCSAGYTCIEAADVCCPSPAFRKLRPGQKVRPLQQKPVYGRPLHSYMPHMMMNDQPIDVEKTNKVAASN